MTSPNHRGSANAQPLTFRQQNAANMRVGCNRLVRPFFMDIQRLRNLTTGRLHTEMGHIYEDLGMIFGCGLMTHMLPRAMRSVEPWLREKITDARFWDGAYDRTHTGEIELPEPTEADRAAMSERYKAQPNPLAGKNVIGVLV